jgi:hypothetical protein
VDTENFLAHDDGRMARTAGRLGAIAAHLAAAGGNLDVTDRQALRIRLHNRLCAHRTSGKRVAGRHGGGRDEAAPAQRRQRWEQCFGFIEHRLVSP